MNKQAAQKAKVVGPAKIIKKDKDKPSYKLPEDMVTKKK